MEGNPILAVLLCEVLCGFSKLTVLVPAALECFETRHASFNNHGTDKSKAPQLVSSFNHKTNIAIQPDRCSIVAMPTDKS
jgi:hypothetical protein